jgi:hypothetical protein
MAGVTHSCFVRAVGNGWRAFCTTCDWRDELRPDPTLARAYGQEHEQDEQA